MFNNIQNFKIHENALNNPLVYVAHDSEFIWFMPLVVAIVFGIINLAIQTANGENHLGNKLKAFGSAAIVGAALAVGVRFGFAVPYLSTSIEVIIAIYAAVTIVGAISGLANGLINGDWSKLGNTVKLLAGNFYLDGNRNFFGQVLQGLSRFTWEIAQTAIGYAYSQFRNAIGGVNRVDYFGGVSFSSGESKGFNRGVSIGNFINMDISDEIRGSFAERLTNDPLFMHEYGHTSDSKTFGLTYLFSVGIPSLLSAFKSKQAPGEINGVTTHNFKWYEMSANRNAAHYFKKYHEIEWDRPYLQNTYETYYPRTKRR